MADCAHDAVAALAYHESTVRANDEAALFRDAANDAFAWRAAVSDSTRVGLRRRRAEADGNTKF
jgi:hypothetical protein